MYRCTYVDIYICIYAMSQGAKIQKKVQYVEVALFAEAVGQAVFLLEITYSSIFDFFPHF